ncbi:MAG TPA: hypothetical protein VL501_00045 [Pyrinomonadaceae bacterium]|nr:hypothetical protein [Pyrinomonadaceae bacterium]
MFTKFYWGLWTVLAMITVGLFAVDRLGWLEFTVIGFVSCLFIFMGMMCVTPTIVGPHVTEHEPMPEAAPEPKKKAAAKDVSFARAGMAVTRRHA